jgi:hypothetical protein
MENILEKFYYNPAFGFISADKLYKKVKSHGITLKQVKEFIKKQETNQIHFKRRKINYIHISATKINQNWQMDLTEIPYQNENDGYRYILCIVDVYSRFARAVPLKNKNQKGIRDALENIFEHDIIPESITSDLGKEFNNNVVRSLLELYNVHHYFAEVGDKFKMGIVERFNRTLKSILFRYMTAVESHRWIDVLHKVIVNYNHTFNTGIHNEPINVKNGDYINDNRKGIQEFNKFNIGDIVRIMVNKTEFTKGYQPKFSKALYKISDIDKYSFIVRTYPKDGYVKRKLKFYEMLKV